MTASGALLRVVAASLALGLCAPSVRAAGLDLSEAPPGAASCSGCHAGRAAAGSIVPAIDGRPAEEIVVAMAEFRAGRRAATVMNRIAPGFTDEESRAIAAWLSAR